MWKSENRGKKRGEKRKLLMIRSNVGFYLSEVPKTISITPKRRRMAKGDGFIKNVFAVDTRGAFLL